MEAKSILILLLLCVMFFSGCETLKGAGHGMKEGFQKDVSSFKQKKDPIHKADSWLQEHLW